MARDYTLQALRATTAARLADTPVDGELVIDTTLRALAQPYVYVGDGATAGGVLAQSDYVPKSTGGTFDGAITVAPAAGGSSVNIQGAAQALVIMEHTASAGTNDNYIFTTQNGVLAITQRVGTTETRDVIRVQDTGTALFGVAATFNQTVGIVGNVGLSPLAGVASMFINGYGQARVVMRDLTGTADQRRFSLNTAGSVLRVNALNDAGVSQRTVWQAFFDGGTTCETVAGGSKGANTLNWASIFQNNVAVQVVSDERTKTDIEPMDAGLDDVRRLREAVRKWQWKEPDAHVGEPTEGFVAQRLESLGFDDLVITDRPGEADESKRIDKAAMPIIARLVNAVCELSERVEALEARA